MPTSVNSHKSSDYNPSVVEERRNAPGLAQAFSELLKEHGIANATATAAALFFLEPAEINFVETPDNEAPVRECPIFACEMVDVLRTGKPGLAKRDAVDIIAAFMNRKSEKLESFYNWLNDENGVPDIEITITHQSIPLGEKGEGEI